MRTRILTIVVFIAFSFISLFPQGWSKAEFGDSKTNKLYWSIEDDNVDVVKQYLKDKWDIEKKCGPLKQTILHYAATIGSEKVVNFLIDKGANLNATRKGNASVLMDAMPLLPNINDKFYKVQKRIFLKLLKNPKTDISYKNNGKNILDMAIKIKQTDLIDPIKKEFAKRKK